jgi:hypothetical protein
MPEILELTRKIQSTYIFGPRWFHSQETRREERARSIAPQASSPRHGCRLGSDSGSRDPREFSPLKKAAVFYLVQLFWPQSYYFVSFSWAFSTSNMTKCWGRMRYYWILYKHDSGQGSKIRLRAGDATRGNLRVIQCIQIIKDYWNLFLFKIRASVCVADTKPCFCKQNVWALCRSKRDFRLKVQGSFREPWERHLPIINTI